MTHFRYLGLVLILALSACATPRQTATPSPSYKVGKPYKVRGQWYHPREDPDYQAVGVASWYGRDFHGRRTANGEIYDMHRLSAAHKTLPMPSMVEVVNLENGRKVNVRVNDRGPFADNRIIDLSREAAKRLGFQQKGLARVRVRYLGPAPIMAKAPTESKPRRLARAMSVTPVADTPQANPIPEPPETMEAIEQTPSLAEEAEQYSVAEAKNETEEPALFSAAEASTPPPEDARISAVSKPAEAAQPLYIIRVASLSRLDNIAALRSELEPFGPLRMAKIELDDQRIFYRVTMGPFSSIETAAERLDQVRAAGYDDASMATLAP